jgi:hypothetical protein
MSLRGVGCIDGHVFVHASKEPSNVPKSRDIPGQAKMIPYNSKTKLCGCGKMVYRCGLGACFSTWKEQGVVEGSPRPVVERSLASYPFAAYQLNNRSCLSAKSL